MKFMCKHFAFILSLLSFMAVNSSCSSSEMEDLAPEETMEAVTFKLKISPLKTTETRSLAPGYHFSDGKSISILKCYVYNTAKGQTAAPVKTIDIDIKTINGNNGGDVTIPLPKGESYDVVFLGTSIPQTDSSSKLYYNTTARTLNLNYSLIKCNDEEIDCFFAARQNVTSESVTEETIELSRPFAQMNIGTQDYTTYNTSNPVKNISVSVDGIYESVNLMDGKLVGSPIKANYVASAIPSGQSFPVSGYSYLTMNYLLVNLRQLADVTMTVNHTNSSTAAKEINITGVAVERNYQTNIYGKNLLTEDIIE